MSEPQAAPEMNLEEALAAVILPVCVRLHDSFHSTTYNHGLLLA
jgi:hypothetical protein